VNSGSEGWAVKDKRFVGKGVNSLFLNSAKKIRGTGKEGLRGEKR